MNFIRIAAFLLAAATVNTVNAQEEQKPETGATVGKDTVMMADRHEYSFYLRGGASSTVYTLTSGGSNRGNFGIGGGFAYTYNINAHFGISAGVELATFGGKATYGSLSDEYTAIDDNGTATKYKVSVTDYEETQNIAMLSVPVMIQYKTPLVSGIHFYLGGGLKPAIPLSARSVIIPGEVTTSAYYSNEGVTYAGINDKHGIYTKHKPGEQTGDIDAGIAIIMSLETGLRFTMGKTALYTGLYFDYAVNDMKQTNSKHPLNYDRVISYESVLNTGFTDKLNLTSIGFKVRLSFF